MRSIVESIIKNGYIVKPYIGVSVEDVSSEMTSYGLPAGAVVRSVTDGAPAAQAGLQANDIITAVDGTEITGSNDLVQIVTSKKAGDTLKLSVYRQGQTLELTVTVSRAEAVRAGQLKRYAAEPAAGSEPAATAGRRAAASRGASASAADRCKINLPILLFSFFLS